MVGQTGAGAEADLRNGAVPAEDGISLSGRQRHRRREPARSLFKDIGGKALRGSGTSPLSDFPDDGRGKRAGPESGQHRARSGAAVSDPKGGAVRHSLSRERGGDRRPAKRPPASFSLKALSPAIAPSGSDDPSGPLSRHPLGRFRRGSAQLYRAGSQIDPFSGRPGGPRHREYPSLGAGAGQGEGVQPVGGDRDGRSPVSK